MVVTTGETEKLLPVPSPLFQEYVVPPPAVSVVEVPIQIATSGPAFIGAFPFMVTVTGSVLTQPAALVPVTVYTVVAPGVQLTVAPVVALK